MKKFKKYLQRKDYSSTTINSYQAKVNKYLQWLKTEEIEAEQATQNDILAYMKSSQQKGHNQGTIQHQLVSINHYYDHLKQEEQIHNNPVTSINIKGIKRNTLHQILQPHQLYQDYQTSTPTEKRNKVILGLLVYQGLKTEEVGKLEQNDLDLRQGEITVHEGRRNNERTLKLEAHQMLDIYDYTLQVRPLLTPSSPHHSTRLFISPGGSENPALMMRGIIKQVKKLNPTVQSLQQLRASVITKWLKQYNLRETQYRAGHRFISSTEAYRQNDIEGLKEEIQQYHPLG